MDDYLSFTESDLACENNIDERALFPEQVNFFGRVWNIAASENVLESLVLSNLAKLLAELNSDLILIYVSGAGTDSSEKGKSMWARIKGKRIRNPSKKESIRFRVSAKLNSRSTLGG